MIWFLLIILMLLIILVIAAVLFGLAARKTNGLLEWHDRMVNPFLYEKDKFI